MNMTTAEKGKTLVYIRESGLGEAEMCVKTDGSFIAVPMTQNQLINIITGASEILARDIQRRKEVH